MRNSGGGSIINTASILAHTGTLPAIYTATKTGVLGMTRAIAVDYAGDGIRCNCVSPGDMETPMIQKYFDATRIRLPPAPRWRRLIRARSRIRRRLPRLCCSWRPTRPRS